MGNDHHRNLFQALHISIDTWLIKLPHMYQRKLKLVNVEPAYLEDKIKSNNGNCAEQLSSLTVGQLLGVSWLTTADI